MCATDIPEVTLELQNERQPNWRDTPTPMTCKIKGVSPDMVVRSGDVAVVGVESPNKGLGPLCPGESFPQSPNTGLFS